MCVTSASGMPPLLRYVNCIILNFTRKSSNSTKCYKLFSWGWSEYGALGLQKKKIPKLIKYKHQPVRHYFAEEHKVVNVASGFGFSAIAVESDDLYKVFGCGINTDSQIGCHEPRKNHPLEVLFSPAPIYLGLKNRKTNIIGLDAGRAHLVISTDNEGVLTLGSNSYGQCGRKIIEEEKYTGNSYVHKIDKLNNENIKSVVCGQDHTLFLTETGKVYSCGWGADGQLGNGSLKNIGPPELVEGDIKDENIIKLASKSDTILALNDKGEVFGWGNSEYSQLVSSVDVQILKTPQYLKKLSKLGRIKDVASGGSFCIALTENREVYVWGYGILGAGPEVDMAKEPCLLPKTLFGCNEFQPDSYVTSVSCGLNFLAAINNYQHLYTWGKNKMGCLGIGHKRDQYFPYRVAIGAKVIKVTGGVDHTMALCESFD